MTHGSGGPRNDGEESSEGAFVNFQVRRLVVTKGRVLELGPAGADRNHGAARSSREPAIPRLEAVPTLGSAGRRKAIRPSDSDR